MKYDAGGLSSLYSIKDNILVMWIILSYTISHNIDLIIGALNSADSRVHTLKVFNLRTLVVYNSFLSIKYHATVEYFVLVFYGDILPAPDTDTHRHARTVVLRTDFGLMHKA